VAPAHADVRGVVRFGLLPIELESSRETPLFGDEIDRAVTAYNDAAAAYDQRFGGSTERVSESDLGVDDTLVTFSPGFEVGNSIAFFRLEAQLGYSDDLRSYGVGVYPLNLQTPFTRDVTAYVSAGGTASWLDRDGSDIGALVTARAAGGVRISRRIVVEAGYGAFMLGGVVDRDALADYTPSPDAPPPSPRDVVAAGEGSGVVDLSVGVVF
jgi:hypothetical protein